MKITDLSHCSNRLTFLSQKEWLSTMPHYLYQGVLLTKVSEFRGNDSLIQANEGLTQVIELDDQLAFEDVIFDIYRGLGLMDLCFLVASAEALSVRFHREPLFAKFGFRYCENLEKLIQKFIYLESEFCHWAIAKQLGENDLSPLRSLEPSQVRELNPYLKLIAHKGLSKSEGALAFEHLIDLYLQDSLKEPSLDSFRDMITPDFIQALYRLRNPVSFLREEKSRGLIKKYSWPKNAQARSVRKGDQFGVELKVFSASRDEMKKQLVALQLVVDRMGEESVEKF